MMKLLSKPRWSPYVVGAAIGILSWITFGLMNKALGTSTTFVCVAGLIESLFAPDHVKENAYFSKYIIDKPAVDWQMMLVLGLLLGACSRARLANRGKWSVCPNSGRGASGRAGGSVTPGRSSVACSSCSVVRLAGGCTSGHGISGGLQFALSSWLFFASFFIAGLATAFAIFGREGRCHV